MKNIQPLLMLLILACCGQMNAQVDLKNIKEINTKELDFAPVPFNNGIIYTSSKSNRFLACPSENAGDYTDLFYAPKNADGSYGKPVAIKGGVNGKYNDGAATFNATGNKMIFTRNNISGKNDQNVIDLKLYSADLEGDAWKNVIELPINIDTVSSCHPTLSKDGTLLIYSSNRQGSVGGMDLWGSRLVNGVWAEPFNLGPGVNTDSNEIFPNLDELGNLFFSSNRQGGAGGLDIFAAKAGTGNTWNLVGPLDPPFNGAGDDVAFVSMNNGTEGYFATAGRSDSKGRDDIYHWTRKPEPIQAIIVVIDEDTKARLPDANVGMNPLKYGNILDQIYGTAENIANKPLQMKTGADGSVTVQVFKNAEYAISVDKEDYEPARRQPTTEQLTAVKEYIIPIKRRHFQAKLIGLVIDEADKSPIPLPDVTIKDLTTGKSIELKGDGEGSFTSIIDCDHEYEVFATAKEYNSNSKALEDFSLDCRKTGEVRVVIPLKKPMIVYLESIYYDFDRSYIRKTGAADVLDKTAEIMKKYPTLKVSLSAHCDARGPTEYNDALGKRRADSAKKYLVEKGIDPSRVSTESFGERKPVNKCVDGVYCTEPAHQINRRMDILPVEHKEVGIEFRSRPVKPDPEGTN